MKLSLLDLQIIANTLSGSLNIRDNGTYFGFTIDSRKKLLYKLWAEMNETEMTVNVEPPNKTLNLTSPVERA